MGAVQNSRWGAEKLFKNLIGDIFTNFWLINIDFNDIETPNDIGEADDLEATFNLENMELGLAVPGRRCPCFPPGKII